MSILSSHITCPAGISCSERDESMDERYAVMRFDGAVRLLPQSMRSEIRALTFDMRASAEEIRLRKGSRPTVLSYGREIPFSENKVTKRDLDALFELACGGSAHTVRDAVASGYVTAPGGYRVGLCGVMAVSDGAAISFREITSVCIRISREVLGSADGIEKYAVTDGKIASTLIISPPGGGKTTFLRDTVRKLSDLGYRVSVADERSEIGGSGAFRLGCCTDVIEGCRKSDAVMMLLRSMSPQVIALDEITEDRDIDAVIMASYCGTAMIATAHAESIEDLGKRPLYKRLMQSGIFGLIVVIKNRRTREYEYIRTVDICDKSTRCGDDNMRLRYERYALGAASDHEGAKHENAFIVS